MTEAMNAGKSSQGTSAVIDVCEGFLKKQGRDDILNNPEFSNIMSSFKQKSLNDVIPHAINLLKERGKLSDVLKFFG